MIGQTLGELLEDKVEKTFDIFDIRTTKVSCLLQLAMKGDRPNQGQNGSAFSGFAGQRPCRYQSQTTSLFAL